MSTPRYDWWSYVKGMIRRYPELCRREADLHTTAVTPNYGGAPGGHGGRSDPVANAALRTMPEINRREMDAVRAAIRTAESLPSGRERMELVKLYYWKRFVRGGECDPRFRKDCPAVEPRTDPSGGKKLWASG